MKPIADSRRRGGTSSLLLAALLVTFPSRATFPATFTVNSNGDGADAVPGDGVCMVASASVCTLRAAIQEANATPALDDIAFDIPGDGPHTIKPSSALPAILEPLTLDGFTQTGAQPNTHPAPMGLNAVMMIEIDGADIAGPADGLRIVADNSVVRGLVVNRFPSTGINVGPGTENRIEGNFIGIDVSGTIDAGNGHYGVAIGDDDNVVGGLTAAARNLISGNLSGVSVISADANRILGNLIGTSALGVQGVGNMIDGIVLHGGATNTFIGGSVPGAANVVAASGRYGIYVDGFTHGAVIQGNVVGRPPGGAGNMGNVGGIVVINSWDNVIGGSDVSEGNLVAFNNDDGIVVRNEIDVRNDIRSNRIVGNASLGIDLAWDGVSENDAADADAGPNGFQNYPLLTFVDPSTGLVTGTIATTPDTTLRIQLFANSLCDPSGHGEGEALIGTAVATTGPDGHDSFELIVTDPGMLGVFLTATATDPDGNTSEFSPCLPTDGSATTTTSTSTTQPPTTTIVPVSTTTTTLAAGPGTITGAVLAEQANGGTAPVAGATVEVCSNVCQLVVSGVGGAFQATNVPAGQYTLRAFPPGLSSPLLPAQRGPFTLAPGQLLAGQDLVLALPQPPTPAAGIVNSTPTSNGIPSVYYRNPLQLRATGCPGGSASYELRRGLALLRSGPMTEQPAGTYAATIAPLYPTTGTAQVVVTIVCPGGSQQRLAFDVYIDPSGIVVDQTGAPLAGATVTLLRADQAGGPFEVVPDGSALLSPANRRNPDRSRADGRFGWDVLAGFYVVRAERAGCTAPGGGTVVETPVLPVPPPVTDLVLQLVCPVAPTPPVEDCGNCRDDDGDGDVDLEDADCCAGGTTALTLRTALMKPRNGNAGSKLALAGNAPWTLAQPPVPSDVLLQLRAVDADTGLCATFPAAAFQRRKQTLRLRHGGSRPDGLSSVTLKGKPGDPVALAVAGKRTTLAVPGVGDLRVTWALRDGAGQVRCSGTRAALRPAKKGALRFP